MSREFDELNGTTPTTQTVQIILYLYIYQDFFGISKMPPCVPTIKFESFFQAAPRNLQQNASDAK